MYACIISKPGCFFLFTLGWEDRTWYTGQQSFISVATTFPLVLIGDGGYIYQARCYLVAMHHKSVSQAASIDSCHHLLAPVEELWLLGSSIAVQYTSFYFSHLNLKSKNSCQATRDYFMHAIYLEVIT